MFDKIVSIQDTEASLLAKQRHWLLLMLLRKIFQFKKYPMTLKKFREILGDFIRGNDGYNEAVYDVLKKEFALMKIAGLDTLKGTMDFMEKLVNEIYANTGNMQKPDYLKDCLQFFSYLKKRPLTSGAGTRFIIDEKCKLSYEKKLTLFLRTNLFSLGHGLYLLYKYKEFKEVPIFEIYDVRYLKAVDYLLAHKKQIVESFCSSARQKKIFAKSSYDHLGAEELFVKRIDGKIMIYREVNDESFPVILFNTKADLTEDDEKALLTALAAKAI